MIIQENNDYKLWFIWCQLWEQKHLHFIEIGETMDMWFDDEILPIFFTQEKKWVA